MWRVTTEKKNNMPANINQFLSSLSRRGPARSNRFDASFPVPLPLVLYRTIAQQLSLRCEVADLPGRNFSTLEQKIYGPTEKFPYQPNYNEMSMAFLVSESMAEKQFFDAWMDLINPVTNFNFKYKSEYVTPITINQYAQTGEKIYSIDLIDAFPLTVNQLDLDWSSDSNHKLMVSVAYTYWRNNSIQNVLNSAVTSITGSVSSAILGSPRPSNAAPLNTPT